jgi:hypothetical protein
MQRLEALAYDYIVILGKVWIHVDLIVLIYNIQCPALWIVRILNSLLYSYKIVLCHHGLTYNPGTRMK